MNKPKFKAGRSQEEAQRFPMRNDLTKKDCEKEEFSGIRHNVLGGVYEIWMRGVIRGTVSEELLALNEFALTEKMAEICQLHTGNT